MNVKFLAMAFLPFFSHFASANPHPDPKQVPQDEIITLNSYEVQRISPTVLRAKATEVLRVDIIWDEAKDAFRIGSLHREKSGTGAFLARSKSQDQFGSYQGFLNNIHSNVPFAFDSMGTGSEFRRLVRGLTLRFPMPTAPVELTLVGEDPQTGVMKTLLTERLDLTKTEDVPVQNDLEVRELKKATASPALIVNIYADAYRADQKDRFFSDAIRVTTELERAHFPKFENMHLNAVFAPSKLNLGKATNLGLPVPERDSFLGLYFPYWSRFPRWYNCMYPTREVRYRNGLAQVPYDYPIVLMDSSDYWGCGNYNEMTVLPNNHSSFRYLLLHEFGHFFGLNEEYEGGGMTDLNFAPKIREPWSQNITFLRDPAQLKWGHFVAPGVAIPTPSSQWTSGKYGAYRGGYADSEPRNTSHKPGLACMMSSGSSFCPVCLDAIEAKIKFDLGESE